MAFLFLMLYFMNFILTTNQLSFLGNNNSDTTPHEAPNSGPNPISATYVCHLQNPSTHVGVKGVCRPVSKVKHLVARIGDGRLK